MDRFHVVREEKPDVPVTGLSTIIAKEWNSLPDEKKQKYFQNAKNAKDQRLSVSFFTKEYELDSKTVKNQYDESGGKKEKNNKGKVETIDSNGDKSKGNFVMEASIPLSSDEVSSPPSSEEVSSPHSSEEVFTPPSSDPLPSEEASKDLLPSLTMRFPLGLPIF